MEMSRDNEKRNKKKAIPNHLDHWLNKLQMTTLLQLETLGWKLWFVRRPRFQPVMPVLWDPTNSVTAVIEEDGYYNTNHGYLFRPDEVIN